MLATPNPEVQSTCRLYRFVSLAYPSRKNNPTQETSYGREEQRGGVVAQPREVEGNLDAKVLRDHVQGLLVRQATHPSIEQDGEGVAVVQWVDGCNFTGTQQHGHYK